MVRCAVCGVESPDQFRFCGACGARLAPVEARPREVRKTVSVLFADVAGSTQLGERQDPEATRALMTRYFGAMKALIEQHGGTVEKFIGDAVMAVFGIPTLHEDDALRAVRAADAIRVTLDRLNVELEAERGISIRMRIGVNTGEVVAGDPSTGQTLVTGDTVNTAARLEAAAPPGEIFIGAVTWRLVRGAVAAEAVEPLTLKGKAEPVPAWRVTAVEGSRVAAPRRLDTVLVGRDRELRRLRDAWASVVGGRGSRLVTVLGPAGIGKTRLVAELGATVATDGGRMLRGRCLSYGEGATFWPLRELVVAATGAADDDPPEAIRARLEAVLAGHADAERISHVVGDAIGTAARGLGRSDVFDGVRGFLEALAASGPLLVLWDDVQWAEPMLLDLVEAVAGGMPEARILTVCAGREELLDRRAGWGASSAADTIVLEPLPAVAADELLAGLLGGRHLPPPLPARLAATAEGNPLFLTETVAMLVEEGSIRETDDGWAFAAGLAEVPIPPTVQALVAARLDQLAPGSRLLAEVASVIGRTFGDDELAGLAEADEATVATGLAGLVASAIVRPERRAGAGSTYRFRHLLLRDACYDAMSKDRRATLHERRAGQMVAAGDGRADGLEPIVGAHLEQAARYRGELGQPAERLRLAGEAATWLERGGRAAVRRHDPAAAASLLARAIALLPADAPDRMAATLQLAEARRQGGDLDASRALLDEVADTAIATNEPALAVRARVLRAWLDGTGADEASRMDADDDETLSLLWGLRLDRAYDAGRMADAGDAAEAVMRHAAAAGDPWLVARRARAVLVDVGIVDGTPVPEALARCRSTLEAAGHDRRFEAAVLAAMARLAAMGGDLEAARRHAADGRALAADLGLYPRVFAEEATAAVAGAGGDDDAEAVALHHAGSLAREAGDHALGARLDVARAAALVRAGRTDDAGAAIATAAAGGAGSGSVETRMRLAGVRAGLAARAGDEEAARRDAAASQAIAGESDAALWRAEAHEWAGRALAAIGDPGGAPELDTAVRAYAAKGATRLAARAAGTPATSPPARPATGTVHLELDDAGAMGRVLADAGLGGPAPVLLLVGGADGLSDAQLARVNALFEDVLPDLATDLGAAVVDGGSDSGIMRAAGLAWRAARCEQPLVGVMARGTIATSEAGAARRAGTGTATPEPNHTHLVEVPGDRWGDERPWLLGVAAAMSGDRPRAMLLVNGGPLARREALEAAADGVPVLVLRDSGRVADELADAVDGGEPVIGPGGADVGNRIRVVSWEAAALRDALREALHATATGRPG